MLINVTSRKEGGPSVRETLKEREKTNNREHHNEANSLME